MPAAGTSCGVNKGVSAENSAARRAGERPCNCPRARPRGARRDRVENIRGAHVVSVQAAIAQKPPPWAGSRPCKPDRGRGQRARHLSNQIRRQQHTVALDTRAVPGQHVARTGCVKRDAHLCKDAQGRGMNLPDSSWPGPGMGSQNNLLRPVVVTTWSRWRDSRRDYETWPTLVRRRSDAVKSKHLRPGPTDTAQRYRLTNSRYCRPLVPSRSISRRGCRPAPRL